MDQKVAIFQHVANEPSGYFESIFQEYDICFEYIPLHDTNEVPQHLRATHLLFMGGPMSVNDESEFPWLVLEKELIRKSVKNHQNVLGICLGAQLIASAYGAKVYPFVKETGWHPLNRAEDSDKGPFFRFPEQFHVFQLHRETFEIPYGGRLLAHGRNVKSQAFLLKNALGLQFHLEMTEEIVREWSKDLSRHQRSLVARDTPRYLAESNRLCHMIAENFTGSFRK